MAGLRHHRAPNLGSSVAVEGLVCHHPRSGSQAGVFPKCRGLEQDDLADGADPGPEVPCSSSSDVEGLPDGAEFQGGSGGGR